MTEDEVDPGGLIRESYRIDGITDAECRSIFLDWALKLSPGIVHADAIADLLARHGAPGHPMTAVLRQGLETPRRTGRRGGRAGQQP